MKHMTNNRRRRAARCVGAIWLTAFALFSIGALVDGQDTARVGASTGGKGSGTTAALAVTAAVVPDAKQAGGEPDGIVQVANLVYAGTKSSQCFADHFLVEAQRQSSISTSRRFHAVKLASDDIYEFPMLIMTGEGTFQLSNGEREAVRRYVRRGGLLLASAGCSSTEWDRAFRGEMAFIFPGQALTPIGMEHAVFHTVFDIHKLQTKHGEPRPLEGITLDGRIGVIYSQDGLNDTAHTQGCCCCGGNEIYNAIQINVNILAYALTH